MRKISIYLFWRIFPYIFAMLPEVCVSKWWSLTSSPRGKSGRKFESLLLTALYNCSWSGGPWVKVPWPTATTAVWGVARGTEFRVWKEGSKRIHGNTLWVRINGNTLCMRINGNTLWLLGTLCEHWRTRVLFSTHCSHPYRTQRKRGFFLKGFYRKGMTILYLCIDHDELSPRQFNCRFTC